MDQVQAFAIAVRPQERLDAVQRHFHLQRGQSFQSKDGVIEVALAPAVAESAVGKLLAAKESLD